jgi:hypothetical protein
MTSASRAVAFEMFQAQYGRFIQVAEETARGEVDIHGLAITPFAFPLLVGPAELSIMITLSNDNPCQTTPSGCFRAHDILDRTDAVDGRSEGAPPCSARQGLLFGYSESNPREAASCPAAARLQNRLEIESYCKSIGCQLNDEPTGQLALTS